METARTIAYICRTDGSASYGFSVTRLLEPDGRWKFRASDVIVGEAAFSAGIRDGDLVEAVQFWDSEPQTWESESETLHKLNGWGFSHTLILVSIKKTEAFSEGEANHFHWRNKCIALIMNYLKKIGKLSLLPCRVAEWDADHPHPQPVKKEEPSSCTVGTADGSLTVTMNQARNLVTTRTRTKRRMNKQGGFEGSRGKKNRRSMIAQQKDRENDRNGSNGCGYSEGNCSGDVLAPQGDPFEYEPEPHQLGVGTQEEWCVETAEEVLMREVKRDGGQSSSVEWVPRVFNCLGVPTEGIFEQKTLVEFVKMLEDTVLLLKQVSVLSSQPEAQLRATMKRITSAVAQLPKASGLPVEIVPSISDIGQLTSELAYKKLQMQDLDKTTERRTDRESRCMEFINFVTRSLSTHIKRIKNIQDLIVGLESAEEIATPRGTGKAMVDGLLSCNDNEEEEACTAVRELVSKTSSTFIKNGVTESSAAIIASLNVWHSRDPVIVDLREFLDKCMLEHHILALERLAVEVKDGNEKLLLNQLLGESHALLTTAWNDYGKPLCEALQFVVTSLTMRKDNMETDLAYLAQVLERCRDTYSESQETEMIFRQKDTKRLHDEVQVQIEQVLCSQMELWASSANTLPSPLKDDIRRHYSQLGELWKNGGQYQAWMQLWHNGFSYKGDSAECLFASSVIRIRRGSMLDIFNKFIAATAF